LGERKLIENRHPEVNLIVLGPAARALRQMQFYALCLCGGQFAIDVRG
jgi:hypothetical protein